MMSLSPATPRRQRLDQVRPPSTPSATGFEPVSSRRGALASQPAVDLPPEFDDDDPTEPNGTALRDAALKLVANRG